MSRKYAIAFMGGELRSQFDIGGDLRSHLWVVSCDRALLFNKNLLDYEDKIH